MNLPMPLLIVVLIALAISFGGPLESLMEAPDSVVKWTYVAIFAIGIVGIIVIARRRRRLRWRHEGAIGVI